MMPMPIEAIVSEVDLPVIDISEFPQDFDAVEINHLQYHHEIAKLREACKEWGFFHLVNHGIPADLVQKADNVSRDLLSLPTDVKDRALSYIPFGTYYRKRNYESFHLRDPASPGSFEQMLAKICPAGNPKFCETMGTYSLQVSQLAEKIAKLIVASLGLDVKAFFHSHFEKYYSVVRLNGYSAKNMSVGEGALLSHTDLGCLTILYQDDVGGLQARSQQGEWIDVKPLPHSFVINLGDSLKAWSNGRYHSPEHRVVYKGCRDRLSIAFFTSFPEEKEIWAPEELVDENNARRYKPFTYADFWDSSAIKNKNDKDKATLLQRYAGI